MATKTIIFSDLDGTLLDRRTYSFEKAGQALALVQERGIPLVLVSSKTRAEMEQWRSRLRNLHPFITENGGGIFIPAGYFPFPVESDLRGKYGVITLGLPYENVRQRFTELRTRMQAAVRGFGDMTAEEVRDLTGLPAAEAYLAMQRHFDEPFIFERGTNAKFLREIERAGLHWTRGRLFHIMGDHDKGRAVTILRRFYEQQYGRAETIGIGDGPNDLPLLLAVDRPVLVGKASGPRGPLLKIPGLQRTRGEGPEGWNEAILRMLGAGTMRP